MSNTALVQVAKRLSVSEQELHSIVINTVMPNGGRTVTADQFVSFMAVANEYKLNPLTKEIYAFPSKGGGIQPIVSIDGWLKIINSHPEFDGLETEDSIDSNGNLVSITARIFKKGVQRPVVVTEYMGECKGTSEPWQRWPSRMLRHKAVIQCARYAFGLSGIIDPDEADRFESAGVIEKEPSAAPQVNDEKMNTWLGLIQSGKKTPQQLIQFLEGKGVQLSDIQKQELHEAGAIAA